MVKDLNKSIDFYQRMAGLRVDRLVEEGDVRMAFMGGEDHTQVKLLETKNLDGSKNREMYICFEAHKLEYLYKICQEEGLNPSPIQVQVGGTKYFYVYDPDGVSLQFCQYV